MPLPKIVFCVFFFCYAKLFAQPISRAHAHNDYLRPRPLFDALDNGFTSIEADVFLRGEKLIVSHTAIGLKQKPDLETLYLRPLDSMVKANRGFVFAKDSTPVILMIDFKSNGNETYAVLKKLLDKYSHLFAIHTKSIVVKPAPVEILISGSTPDVSLLGDTSLVTLDRGFYALNAPFVTRISEPWSKYFHARKKLSKKEEQRLMELVAQVHHAGKQIRFWAAPDNPTIWETLLRNKVDWVNTDKLKKFNRLQTKK